LSSPTEKSWHQACDLHTSSVTRATIIIYARANKTLETEEKKKKNNKKRREREREREKSIITNE
jgi:hypothetical protein